MVAVDAIVKLDSKLNGIKSPLTLYSLKLPTLLLMIKITITIVDLNKFTRDGMVYMMESKNSLSHVGLNLNKVKLDLLGPLVITSTQMNNLLISLNMETEP